VIFAVRRTIVAFVPSGTKLDRKLVKRSFISAERLIANSDKTVDNRQFLAGVRLNILQ